MHDSKLVQVFCKLCWSSCVCCVFCVSFMGLICFYEYFAYFCFGVFVFTMQLVHGIFFSFYGVSILLLLSFVFPLSCVLLFVPTHIMFLILVVFLNQFFICYVLKFGFLSLGFSLLLVSSVFGFCLSLQFMHVAPNYCLLHWVSNFRQGHWVCLFIFSHVCFLFCFQFLYCQLLFEGM